MYMLHCFLVLGFELMLARQALYHLSHSASSTFHLTSLLSPCLPLPLHPSLW
jgi:hypothetical protein